MSDGRSLIFIDTNVLHIKQSEEVDFSNHCTRAAFNFIVDYIEKNNLQKMVFIAIPNIVLEEFSKQRNENYKNVLASLKNKISLFTNMDECDVSEINLPSEDFNYKDYIKEKVKTSKEFIKIIDLSLDKSKEILEDIISKALENKKPFKPNNDRGFKDALIWHSIVRFSDLNEYDFIYFLTENVSDFDQEFKKEFETRNSKNITLFNDVESLRKRLNDYYHLFEDYPELVAILRADYFSGQLEDHLALEQGLGINNFEILNSCKNIEDCKIEDLEEFDLPDYLSEIIAQLKKVSIEFKNDGKKYSCQIIFDLTVNEIIGGRYEEMEERDL